jgi:hypothetical protein
MLEVFLAQRSQPVADLHAMFLHALDPPDACRKIRAQKPSVDSFVCKPANRGKVQVDRGRGLVGLFEADPVAGHHCR